MPDTNAVADGSTTGRIIPRSDFPGLLNRMNASTPGATNWEVGQAKLTLGMMEEQAEGGRQLVEATNRLVTATHFLGYYTIGLVIATIGLVIVTVVAARSDLTHRQSTSPTVAKTVAAPK